MRIDLPVKGSLEIAMRTQALLDETTSSSLRPELKSFEPLNILPVKEHVSDGDKLFVDLVWMSSEDNTLGDDAGRRWGKRSAGSN